MESNASESILGSSAARARSRPRSASSPPVIERPSTEFSGSLAEFARTQRNKKNIQTVRLPLYEEAIRKFNASKHWAFSGGAMRALAYFSLMETAQKYGYDFKNLEKISCISAGAFVGILLGSRKFSEEEIREILLNLNESNFTNGNSFSNATRLINESGWFSGEPLIQWCADLLVQKGFRRNATFRDLREAGSTLIDFYVGSARSTLCTLYAEYSLSRWYRS